MNRPTNAIEAFLCGLLEDMKDGLITGVSCHKECDSDNDPEPGVIEGRETVTLSYYRHPREGFRK